MSFDRLKVKIRKYKYIFYLKKTVIKPDNLLNDDKYENGFTITNYPRITNIETFNKTLIKLRWYIPHIPDIKTKIFLNISDKLSKEANNILNQAVGEYYNIELINLKTKSYNDHDIILIFKLSKFQLILNKFRKWMKKSLMVDPNFYATIEGNNFRGLLYTLLSDSLKNKLLENSIENYKLLAKKHDGIGKVNLFLTGPTLDTLYDYDFKNSINIICNSIVKNEKYLQHINPDILVFADPVYHYSYNKYAQQFLNDVKNVILKYDIFCIVSERSFPLLYYHLPELRHRLIGVPLYSNKPFNFITSDSFYSAGGASILPIFMLPTGAGLGNELYLIGADGRQKSETFFWKHSNKAQYTDLMKDIMINHPSFFDDRIYEDYYDEYCENLDRVITIIENAGKRVYSLSKSYIPALKSRYYED